MVKKSHMKRGALAAAVTVAMMMGGVVQAQAQSGGMGGSGGAMGSGTETWGTGASGAAGGSGTPVIPQTPATSGGTGTYGTGTDGTGMQPGMSNGMGTYGTGAPEAMGMQDRSGAWGERSARRSQAVTPAITNDSIYPEQWPWEMHGNSPK